ncbi:MAG: hypothetical protein J6V07_01425, partial [Clostridia bacterium]|nr:hypothetical protein [Clostridia bacterium]
MLFVLAKMHSPFWRSLVVCQSCVAAIGAMRFSVRGFGCALFILEKKLMIITFCGHSDYTPTKQDE